MPEIVDQAVAAERERCAKIAEDYAGSFKEVPHGALEWATALKLAVSIREGK